MIIIKSLKRKTASFSQLLHYINKGRVENDNFYFKHNVYSNKPHTIVREFIENSNYLKRRKNGNVLYHEIFSIKYQAGYTKEELRKILLNTTEQYIKARAGNCLVYAVVHEQHNQIHMHLMISANEIGSSKPYYFSKAEFNKIIELTRDYAYNKYPKLEREEKVHKKPRAKSKTIDNEVQYKKRTGKKSDRELMKEKLQSILNNSKTPQAFIKTLEDEKIRIYKRGKTFGFLDETTGKKYRLKTLELEREFEALNNQFTKDNEPNKEHTRAETDNKPQFEKEPVTHRYTKQHQQDDYQAEHIKTGIDKAKMDARAKFMEQMKEARQAQKKKKEHDLQKDKQK